MALYIGFPGGFQVENPQGFAFSNAGFGEILSQVLKFAFPFAGLILFFVLISGGFQFLTSAGNPESMEKAQKKITNAVIGFFIIFLSYWILQIIENIFGIKTFQ